MPHLMYLKNVLAVTALAFSLPALANSEIRLSAPGQDDWCLGTGGFTEQSGLAHPPMDARAVTAVAIADGERVAIDSGRDAQAILP